MGKFIYGKLHKISDMPVNLAKIIQNITSMVLPIQSVAFHKFFFFFYNTIQLQICHTQPETQQ